MLRLHWIFFVIIGGLGIVLAALISREQPDMTHVLYAWSIPFQLLFLTWLGARLLVLYERAEPPHRTKLKVSFAIAFCVLILGLGTAALLWDRSWLWLLAKSMVPAVGIVAVYSLPVARQSRVLWGLFIASLCLAALFGNATAAAVQYRPQIVAAIVLCAISVLSSGFWLAHVVIRRRLHPADNAVSRSEARKTRPPIESNGAQV